MTTGFPFTKKKLLSLPSTRRHKWAANWLREVYTGIISDNFTPATLEVIFQNLVRLHNWLDLPLDKNNRPGDRGEWIALVADTFHDHQRLTGLGLSEPDLLPHVATGDKIEDGPWKPGISYCAALDNLRSAFNVGAVFRLVDAVAFESVLMTEKTPGPENRQVQKTAMGATDWIPGEKTDQLTAKLAGLKKQGYRCIGLETVRDAADYRTYPWPERGVVVLGNEEYGISGPVLGACDDFVRIPMSGRKNSINVATAFAVIAFHISSLLSGLNNG